MLDEITRSLKAKFDPVLVDELLSAYKEAKHNFLLGGLRLSAVEGGRFCEAAMRLLQEVTTGRFTPLSQSVDSERLFQQLRELPRGTHPDSIRLNIPECFASSTTYGMVGTPPISLMASIPICKMQRW